MIFFVWWFGCYIVWAVIILWSDLPEVPENSSAQLGFLTGLAGLLFLWPISVVAHVVAETRWGQQRGFIPLFVRWRKVSR